MNICRECRHWMPIPMTADGEYEGGLPGETEPSLGQRGVQIGECKCEFPTRGLRPEVNGLLLYSYEDVRMVTGPAFGCMCFEVRRELLIEAARAFIEARRVHYDCVLEALALCISGSPDAPTKPDTVRLSALEKTQKGFFALLSTGASGDPVVVAGRVLFECFRSGRVVSVGYSNDESTEEIARKKKITTDYVAEEQAAWRALCDAVGAERIAW